MSYASSRKPIEHFLDDPNFLNDLVYLLVHDQDSLDKTVGAGILDSTDFKLEGSKQSKGITPDSYARWIVAETAVTFYKKHSAPIGNTIRSEAVTVANDLGGGASRRGELDTYLTELLKRKVNPSIRDHIVERITKFKAEKQTLALLRECAELNAAHRLPPEKCLEMFEAYKAKLPVSYNGDYADANPVQWPEPLGKAAFHGLAGDVVRAILPDTESDPAALLVQFIVAFGNVIGRTAYWRTEDTPHYLNLFTVLVGKTSKSRKGTSANRVFSLFASLAPDWRREGGGLSTGEGLIEAVRDPVTKTDKSGKLITVDEGVSDKRMLVVEPEFARMLKVSEREGNTLSPTLRAAWDGGVLQTLTRKSPQRATGAHISIIGHVTEEELRLRLSKDDCFNGTANRYLWVCVMRSKLLSMGGKPLARKPHYIWRLGQAIKFALGVEEMGFDAEAQKLWDAGYEPLTESKPGLFGAVISRGDPLVRRIACIYALLDLSPVVKEVHLRAALEVWRYCQDSARFVFGKTELSPLAKLADAIAKVLTAEGLTRNQIRDAFHHNKSSQEIGDALAYLQKHGRARSKEDASSGGRPAERWFRVEGA